MKSVVLIAFVVLIIAFVGCLGIATYYSIKEDVAKVIYYSMLTVIARLNLSDFDGTTKQ